MREEQRQERHHLLQPQARRGILHKSLPAHGFNAGALHGDMDQQQRTETLDKFRDGTIASWPRATSRPAASTSPTSATSSTSTCPIHPDDYVHRIGRTGRAGREGFAATLVTPEDLKALKAIEKMLRQEIPWIDGRADSAELAGTVGGGGRMAGPGGRPRRSTARAAPSAAVAAGVEGRAPQAGPSATRAVSPRPASPRPHRGETRREHRPAQQTHARQTLSRGTPRSSQADDGARAGQACSRPKLRAPSAQQGERHGRSRSGLYDQTCPRPGKADAVIQEIP